MEHVTGEKLKGRMQISLNCLINVIKTLICRTINYTAQILNNKYDVCSNDDAKV